MNRRLSGYLLYSPYEKDGVATYVRERHVDGSHFGATPSGWAETLFESPVALQEEEGRPPYRYPLLWRVSGPRALVLGTHKKVVESFLEREQGLPAGLRPLQVSVNGLVQSVTTGPLAVDLAGETRQLSIGYLHARVPAFGTALKSMSLYGDDITASDLFKGNASLMRFVSCGLRDLVTESELLRLGSDGYVSFYSGSAPGALARRALEVEAVLRLVRDRGYFQTGRDRQTGRDG